MKVSEAEFRIPALSLRRTISQPQPFCQSARPELVEEELKGLILALTSLGAPLRKDSACSVQVNISDAHRLYSYRFGDGKRIRKTAKLEPRMHLDPTVLRMAGLMRPIPMPSLSHQAALPVLQSRFFRTIQAIH